MSRRWLVGGVVAVAGVAAVGLLGAWWFLLRDVATPASVSDALAAYRQHGDGGSSPIPPGVYVYATDGFEQTDALRGATHKYPGTSTITVTGAPCGVRLRWDVLEGRSTTWIACTGPDDWSARSRESLHHHADSLQTPVLDWLRPVAASGRRPVFLYVHYLDPHDPYANPGMPGDRSPFDPDYRGPIGPRDAHRIYAGALAPDDPEAADEGQQAVGRGHRRHSVGFYN